MAVINRRVATAFAAAVSLLVGLLVILLPLSPAGAAASVRVASYSEYTDSNPSTPRHLAGEVVNDGTGNVTDVQVTITLRDSSGTALATAQRQPLLQVLGPGERSPFGYGFAAPAGYDHATVDGITATETTTPTNHGFAMTATVGPVDGSGYRQLDGTIRNDNTTTAIDVTVAVTFYDGTDHVVGVAATNPDDGSEFDDYDDLDPGQSKPFHTSLTPGFPAFARVAYLAESPSAPSPNPTPQPSLSPSATATPTPTATPSASPTASPTGSPSATPSGTGSPSATPTATATPSAGSCTAAVSVDSAEITVGQQVLVTLTGPPGQRVVLEGYSRPATEFAPVRPEVTFSAGGAAQWSVGPSTNTRLRAHQDGCAPSAASALVQVHPVLTFAVRRTGVRQYSFTGRILPGAVNAGRSISLYYRLPGADFVRRMVTPAAGDGSFGMSVTFGRSARVDVDVRTGTDLVNLAARSNNRSLLVY